MDFGKDPIFNHKTSNSEGKAPSHSSPQTKEKLLFRLRPMAFHFGCASTVTLFSCVRVREESVSVQACWCAFPLLLFHVR